MAKLQFHSNVLGAFEYNPRVVVPGVAQPRAWHSSIALQGMWLNTFKHDRVHRSGAREPELHGAAQRLAWQNNRCTNRFGVHVLGCMIPCIKLMQAPCMAQHSQEAVFMRHSSMQLNITAQLNSTPE